MCIRDRLLPLLAAGLHLPPLVPARARVAPSRAAVSMADPASVVESCTLVLGNYGTSAVGGGFDPVDYYYAFLAGCGAAYYLFNRGKGAIEDAKAYDRRSDLSNKLLQESRKRERAEARDAMRKREPATYARLQAEANERGRKKGFWKVFDDEEE